MLKIIRVRVTTTIIFNFVDHSLMSQKFERSFSLMRGLVGCRASLVNCDFFKSGDEIEVVHMDFSLLLNPISLTRVGLKDPAVWLAIDGN